MNNTFLKIYLASFLLDITYYLNLDSVFISFIVLI